MDKVLISIPLKEKQDQLLWKYSPDGELQLKTAYLFKLQQFQDLHWAKTIWCIDVPPSKSMFV